LYAELLASAAAASLPVTVDGGGAGLPWQPFVRGLLLLQLLQHLAPNLCDATAPPRVCISSLILSVGCSGVIAVIVLWQGDRGTGA
jgi:hypothetical protein